MLRCGAILLDLRVGALLEEEEEEEYYTTRVPVRLHPLRHTVDTG